MSSFLDSILCCCGRRRSEEEVRSLVLAFHDSHKIYIALSLGRERTVFPLATG